MLISRRLRELEHVGLGQAEQNAAPRRAGAALAPAGVPSRRHSAPARAARSVVDPRRACTPRRPQVTLNDTQRQFSARIWAFWAPGTVPSNPSELCQSTRPTRVAQRGPTLLRRCRITSLRVQPRAAAGGPFGDVRPEPAVLRDVQKRRSELLVVEGPVESLGAKPPRIERVAPDCAMQPVRSVPSNLSSQICEALGLASTTFCRCWHSSEWTGRTPGSDVRHPQLVSTRCSEVALDQIRQSLGRTQATE